MNRLFALFLFVIGAGLVVVGACGNLTNFVSLNTWGIVWRIGLGILLIILAVVLNNLDSITGSDEPF